MVTFTSLRQVSDNLSYAALRKATYFPHFQKRFFMQTSAGGSVTYGNPDLKAEHSNNFELVHDIMVISG